MVTSILYQYLSNLEKTVIAFDTDHVNSNFSGYKEFNIKRLDIMDNDNINQIKFDLIMEEIVSMHENSHAVIDN